MEKLFHALYQSQQHSSEGFSVNFFYIYKIKFASIQLFNCYVRQENVIKSFKL